MLTSDVKRGKLTLDYNARTQRAAGAAIMNDATRASITAVILAGGRSSRMRTDKAQITWRGRTFVEHLIERLRTQAATIAINCNDATPFQALGLPLLADPFADHRGPLAGILAGLQFSTTPLTLFVPCDNPLLAPDFAERCYQALQPDMDIAYARSGGDNHYLYALMRTSLRDSAAQHLRHGDYAVHRWYDMHRACSVGFDDEADCFININQPSDLSRLPE